MDILIPNPRAKTKARRKTCQKRRANTRLAITPPIILNIIINFTLFSQLTVRKTGLPEKI